MFGSYCRETTTTTGTGNITLAGAVTGFQALANEFRVNSVGIPFQYHIATLDQSYVESGYGYLSNATTLVRDSAPEFTLSAGVAGSGSNVNFPSGTKYVHAAPIGRGFMPVLPTINTTAAASERLESTLFPVGTAGTGTLTNDTVFFVPFFHAVTDTVDAVCFSNTVAGTNNVVCGIYSMNPATGRPLGLLANGAAVSSASTGIRVSSFTAIALPPGWYFLAMLKQTADGTQRTLSGATDLVYGSQTPLGIDSSQDVIVGFTQAQAYSATLPAVGSLTNITSGNAPAMWLRIA